MNETISIVEHLEQLVDTHGLAGIVTALASVCYLKTCDQEPLKGKAYWRRCAHQLDQVANIVEKPVTEACFNL